MADINAIQDYSFLDDFLSKNLESFRRKLFGNYDDKTGYFEEVVEDDAESDVVNDAVNDTVNTAVDDGAEMTEDEYYNDVFGEDPFASMKDNSNRPSGDPVEKKPAGKKGFRSFATYQEGKNALINQLKLYQTDKSKTGIKSKSTLLQAMSIYAPSSDNNNPTHYANFIAKKLGIDVNTPISKIDTKKWADAIEIMEGNKVGNNPGNLRNQAGGTPVAKTKRQQQVGLNDPELDQLYMPLQGTNPIRGLDSGEPVFITDEQGNDYILHGPSDVVDITGPVFEKRIKR